MKQNNNSDKTNINNTDWRRTVSIMDCNEVDIETGESTKTSEIVYNSQNDKLIFIEIEKEEEKE